MPRLANKPRRRPLPLLQLPRKRPPTPAPRRSRRPENHPLFHLWARHHRPIRARASSGDGNKHQLKPHHQVKPHRRQPSSSNPPSGTGTSITCTPAPSLVPAISDGSGRWPRPVLGLESRQFEVALGGAGVMKDGNRRERTAEKEKEKERELAKNGASSPKREGRSRKKQDNARARGRPAAALRPDGLTSYLLLLTSSASPSNPSQCPSQQGPPADDTAPYSRSMLTRPHPPIAAMGDKAEAETGGPPRTDS